MKVSSISFNFFLGAIASTALIFSDVTNACDHDHHDHHDHDHHDHYVLDEIDSRGLGEGGIRPCGSHTPPPADLERFEEELTQYRQETGGGYEVQRQAGIASIIEIDVYFHVIQKQDGTGNLSDELINGQIDVLNDAFGAKAPSYSNCSGGSQPAGINTPFRFKLVKTTRNTNDDWFNGGNGENADTISESLREGDCSALNIYTQDMNYLGFAQFPQYCGNYPIGDYVFLHYGSLPGGNFAPYNEGDTATHEVGHWLGLYHTFQGSCSATNDRVEDTPREESPAFGCPVNRDSCSESGVDPIENFMDYTDDCCMYTFSQGQIDRMVDQARQYRNLEGSNPDDDGSGGDDTTGDDGTGDDDDSVDCVDETSYGHNVRRNGRTKVKDCAWLAGKSDLKIRKFCEKKQKYGEQNGVIYKPPAEACRFTCDAAVKSCDECYQSAQGRFYYGLKSNGKEKTRKCGWLNDQSSETITEICESGESGIYPTAADACPVTCNTGLC